MRRRGFIRQALRALTAAWFPKTLLANWPAEHFASTDFSSQFRRVFSDHAMVDTDAILIQLPEIAENGAVVPITISSELAAIEKIYIWVEKNPTPLAAEIDLAPEMAVYLTARLKMAESCPVIVIAKQGERYLRRQVWVNVMIGGCGTG